MPFEERNIIFYLHELEQIFISQPKLLKSVKGINFKNIQIIEAIHTSKVNSAPPEQLARFSAIIDIPNNNSSTVFYGKKERLVGSKNICFFLSDDTLLEILKNACMEQNIKLPRGGEKKVLVRGITVGLSVTIPPNDIAFES